MNWILQLSVTTFLIILPLSNTIIKGLFYREESILWCSIFVSVLLSIWCIGIIINKKANNDKLKVSFYLTDAIILLYLLIGLINIAIIRNCQIEPIIAIKWIVLLLVYLLFRLLPDKKIILFGLMLSGLIQSIITLLQSLCIFESNHKMFDVTGSFGNPGQLGGWLAVAIIATIKLLSNTIKKKQKIYSILILLALILQAIAFYIADSRASFAGLFIGMIVIFSSSFIRIVKAHKILSIIALFAIIIIGCTLLYQHRPQSAKSRLLIWDVCYTMFKEKPVFGHGVASFNQEYMLYQAQYFKKNTDSHYVKVADNVTYPYNELIHIAVELGIAGVLVIIALFIAVFVYKPKMYTSKIIKALLATLITYSMFSYPSYVFPLLLLFPILMGGINSKVIMRLEIYRNSLILILFILGGIIGIGASQLTFYKNASFHVKLLSKQNNKREGSKNFIYHNFDKLKYNLQFMKIYPLWLSKSIISDNEIDKFKYLFPSCEIYCDLGNLYLKSGDYSTAEEYFITASYMVPTRLRPNYYLWQLYCKCDDPVNAIKTAEKIMNQPLKVENTFTLRAKAEVKEYLKKIK